MKTCTISRLACAVLLAWMTPSLLAATATSETASIGLKSTKEKGIVSIMTDPVLSGGRLVLKIVALNPTAQPLQLRAEDVHVFTAAGKEVPLMSLDALIAEAKGEQRASQSMDSAHQASNYSRPQTSTSNSGELNVTGITGANDAVGRAVSQRSRSETDGPVDPAVQQQVDALKAGILQTREVPPGKADGAQVVTDKIKFGRKEEKALRVVVSFNGEDHEFNFEAPPAK
ncbi:hypothetical protein HNQ60_003760 [Povalibacter uvarum]|uniref:Uncharacterized protein n=1 Tax=Povalibacter uvarum TaxID=732238 RepID=A0A841HQ31_9GAMM|nr:hypothetical protein [Povalibacter uvarum]MBB6094873.1 hypothetical protein [Povalibacter uvarum]